LGTFVRIKTTDHTQIVTPAIKATIEITRRAVCGPPT
jgi:hypothetical protein